MTRISKFCGLGALSAALGVWIVSSPESIRLIGTSSPIPSTLFGLHIHRATSRVSSTPWPADPFKGWRLWAADVTWADLEPQEGIWNFAVLDQYVALAE